MKRAYTKPVIYVEDFELSANIAETCGKPVRGTFAKGTCGIDIAGYGTVFLSTIANCTIKAQDGDYGFCYHVNAETQSLFTS